MKKLFVFALLVGIALLGLSSQADATVVYTLSIGNPALGGFPAPFGTVAVTLTSPTMATIEFTAANTGGFAYLFGDGGSVAFNLNATLWSHSFGSPTNSFPGFSPPSIVNVNSGVEDGFGNFTHVADAFDGYTRTFTNIVIDVVNFSGTWSSDSDVLAPNANGYRAAAHIFATSYPATPGAGALATGFAADGPPAVPEPTSILLLGLGLVGLGRARRRPKR